MVHPDNGILLSAKKKCYQTMKICEGNKCILLSRTNLSEKARYCMYQEPLDEV